jgi:hypothetical protein
MGTTMRAPRPDRRTLLRGLGVSLALPGLESLLPRGLRATPPRRLAILAMPFGMVERWFHPAQAGADWDVPLGLAPLAHLRRRFTVFSNLDHGVRGGHSATNTFLSGVKSTERATNPEGNLTVDQRAAEVIGSETRFPSLVLWDAGWSHTRTGVVVPGLGQPSEAFRRLFVDESESEKVFERASLKASDSILDAVREDGRALARELGSADRAKLDEYFTSIRETERRLGTAREWLDRPRPTVDDPAAPGLASGARDEPAAELAFEAWLDLAHLALVSDSTRVLTLGMPSCNWSLEGATGGYHPMSHHSQHPDILAQLQIVEEFIARQLARFLDRLEATRQADGSSLLDSTTVLFGSGLGDGSSHTNSNLPLLVAGGTFRHGQHLDLGNREPLCNLFLTMLRELGLEDERFNRSTGLLSGLEFG